VLFPPSDDVIGTDFVEIPHSVRHHRHKFSRVPLHRPRSQKAAGVGFEFPHLLSCHTLPCRRAKKNCRKHRQPIPPLQQWLWRRPARRLRVRMWKPASWVENLKTVLFLISGADNHWFVSGSSRQPIAKAQRLYQCHRCQRSGSASPVSPTAIAFDVSHGYPRDYHFSWPQASRSSLFFRIPQDSTPIN